MQRLLIPVVFPCLSSGFKISEPSFVFGRIFVDKKDQPHLLTYDELDLILEYYAEQDKSVAEILSAGYSEGVVRHVVRLVDINVYKRRQAAAGPRI